MDHRHRNRSLSGAVFCLAICFKMILVKKLVAASLIQANPRDR